MPDALHWSTLKHLARSPAHYRYASEHPFTATPSMRLGTAVHGLLLGATYPVVVFPGATRRGKAWDEFASAQDADATILLASEMATAERMAESVRGNADAMARIDGAHELELDWTIAGRSCAGRIDAIGTDLCDLKTGADVSPERFPWMVRKLGYAEQLGWYYDGVIATGRPAPRLACIVAVESVPPHCVVVYELTADLLDMGRKRARALLERLLVCESSDDWPGYAQGPIALDVTESEQDGPALDFGDEAESAQ